MQKLEVAEMGALRHTVVWTVTEGSVPINTDPKVVIVAVGIVQQQARRVVVPYQTSDVLPLLLIEVVVFYSRLEMDV